MVVNYNISLLGHCFRLQGHISAFPYLDRLCSIPLGKNPAIIGTGHMRAATLHTMITNVMKQATRVDSMGLRFNLQLLSPFSSSRPKSTQQKFMGSPVCCPRQFVCPNLLYLAIPQPTHSLNSCCPPVTPKCSITTGEMARLKAAEKNDLPWLLVV